MVAGPLRPPKADSPASTGKVEVGDLTLDEVREKIGALRHEAREIAKQPPTRLRRETGSIVSGDLPSPGWQGLVPPALCRQTA